MDNSQLASRVKELITKTGKNIYALSREHSDSNANTSFSSLLRRLNKETSYLNIPTLDKLADFFGVSPLVLKTNAGEVIPREATLNTEGYFMHNFSLLAESLGLSIPQIAKKAGMHKQSVRQLMHAWRYPSTSAINKLAPVVSLEVEYLSDIDPLKISDIDPPSI